MKILYGTINLHPIAILSTQFVKEQDDMYILAKHPGV